MKTKLARHCNIIHVCVGVALAATALATPAFQGRTTSQRTINETAATLEAARISMVEDTGLRLPGEELRPYLERIAAPLPHEAARVYSARIGHYLAALKAALSASTSLRHMPVLLCVTPANVTVWRHIVRDSAYMPGRVRQTMTAWSAARSGNVKQRMDFGDELESTLRVDLSLLESLRDARP